MRTPPAPTTGVFRLRIAANRRRGSALHRLTWRLVRAVLCTVLVSTCASNSSGPPPASVSALQAPNRPRPGTTAGRTPSISKDLFEPAVRRMVAPDTGGAPLQIVAVAGPVRGWAAVAVSPPYREFPTVVLFRMGQEGSWHRVFEGLIPGVKAEPSALLDLHSKGQAFDYTINGGARVTAETIDKAVAISRNQKLATVAHAFFFHAQPAGPDNYFVDRTATYDLARRLFPGDYDNYPRTECTMFNVPAVRRIELTSAGDQLVLTAQTDNAQTWVIRWTGTDDRGFLTGKTVDARRAG